MWVRGDEIGFVWPESFPDFYENTAAYCQANFHGPGMGWVDPEKDVNAAGKRVEQGLTSPTFEGSVQGQDFRDTVDQIARDHAYARSKGVIIPGMKEYAAFKAPPPPPAAEGGEEGGDAEEGANDEGPPRDGGEAAARELRDQENRK
jgi:capsid protein